jgi:hypothetical protein
LDLFSNERVSGMSSVFGLLPASAEEHWQALQYHNFEFEKAAR